MGPCPEPSGGFARGDNFQTPEDLGGGCPKGSWGAVRPSTARLHRRPERERMLATYTTVPVG